MEQPCICETLVCRWGSIGSMASIIFLGCMGMLTGTLIFRTDASAYYAVSINNQQELATFFQAIHFGPRPTSFFAKHVRVLCVAYGLNISLVLPILSACTGVQSLACWISPTPLEVTNYKIPHVLATLRPQRLSMHFPLILARRMFISKFGL